ncbi:hypothetical protein N0V85_008794 [Neurospora sp. IMI 360204]|nr:hypothetical protein N0V85_008794 [Neurospora sp. IMI 360204]
MSTLRLLLLLLSTIFSPALSSAINVPLPRQAVSNETTTTSTAAPTGGGPPSNDIVLTPPDIPEWSPQITEEYESTDLGGETSTSTSSFEPSGTPLPGNMMFPIISLRPCTTTLTNNNNNNNNNNRPCPPPEWDGTFTSWPSTTTLFKPINCNGCMYCHCACGDAEHDLD